MVIINSITIFGVIRMRCPRCRKRKDNHKELCIECIKSYVRYQNGK